MVTLVREPDAVCVGAAYRVDEAVFEHLDHREKNGYERVSLAMQLVREARSEAEAVNGVTYIAAPGNLAYLGPADIDDMAAQIARSSGPSGSNRDYLFQLAAALNDLGVEDRHVPSVDRAHSFYGKSEVASMLLTTLTRATMTTGRRRKPPRST